MAPPCAASKPEPAGGQRRGHVEQQQRPHAVVAEALPHLGEEERGETARVTEERGVRRSRVGHRQGVLYPSPQPVPPMPLDEYRKKRDFTKTPEPAGRRAGARRGGRALLLRPEAPGQPPALRPAARARRRAAVVGRAQGPVARPARQAPGDADRGSSVRLRLVRRRDSRRLRRRRGDAVGLAARGRPSRPTSTPR